MAKNTSAEPRPAAPSVIDFLPQSYREQHAERASYGWRFVVVLVFALVIASVSTQQRRSRRSLEAALAMARHQQVKSSEVLMRLRQLEAELGSRRTRAEVLTCLRQPWLRSLVLSAVIAPLPRQITLTRLEIVRVMPEGGNGSPGDAAPPPTDAALPTAPPSPDEAALAHLRDHHLKAHLHVSLAGTVADPLDLHGYLAELEQSPLLDSPRIQSLQRETGDRPSVRFVVLVRVQPGFHGVPAPNDPAPGSATASVALRPLARELAP